MSGSAIISKACMMASALVSKVLDEVESSLVTPQELSNEKADEWCKKQKASAKFLLHCSMVDYFNTEKASTKSEMDKLGVLKKAENLNPNDKVKIFEGAIADIVCKVSSIPKSLDRKLIEQRLKGIEGWDDAKIESFFDAVTTTRAPSKTMEAMPHVG